MFFSEWDEPLKLEEVEYVEQNCGLLASTLGELAEIVRKANQSANEGLYDEINYKFIPRIRISARKLRPKIEMAIGKIQAVEFYRELCFTIKYYEDSDYERWRGSDGKAEAIADRLDDWHRTLLLLYKIEMGKQTKSDKLKTKKKRRKREIKLTDKQKKIWEDTQGGATYGELAAKQGCSIPNIRQQYRKAEEKLKKLNAPSRSINFKQIQQIPTDNRGQEVVEDK